ncbi:MAG: DNA repair protein RecO [candidate division WOR-3 bacterium]|nr:DNA repair protein RecO [candidate division WOR-3 bacterium]
MPRIIRTKGICLVSRNFRETSKSVIFYTEAYGKIALIAKGARKSLSKFGSSLEPFVCSELIFYKTEPKSIYILSDASLIDGLLNLKCTNKYFYANQIVELILRTVNFEDPNPNLFRLLYSALKTLNSANSSNNFSSLVTAYFLKTISILGYQPELRWCIVCKNSKTNGFSIKKGGVLCANHIFLDDEIYGKEHIKPLRYLLTAPLEKTLKTSIPQSTAKLVENYINYHLDKVQLHSLRFS